MASVEFGTCSLEKYKAGEAERIPEKELRLKSFYTARFIAEADARAFECPARVLKTEEREAALFIATISLLDYDLRPWQVLPATMRDGYMLGSKQDGEDEVGYLVDYGNRFDEGLEGIIGQAASQNRELVMPSVEEVVPILVPQA